MMTNDKWQITPQDQPQIQFQQRSSEQTDSHLLAISLGVVGGGVAGATFGHSIKGF